MDSFLYVDSKFMISGRIAYTEINEIKGGGVYNELQTMRNDKWITYHCEDPIAGNSCSFNSILTNMKAVKHILVNTCNTQ